MRSFCAKLQCTTLQLKSYRRAYSLKSQAILNQSIISNKALAWRLFIDKPVN